MAGAHEPAPLRRLVGHSARPLEFLQLDLNSIQLLSVLPAEVECAGIEQANQVFEQRGQAREVFFGAHSCSVSHPPGSTCTTQLDGGEPGAASQQVGRGTQIETLEACGRAIAPSMVVTTRARRHSGQPKSGEKYRINQAPSVRKSGSW